VFDLEEFLKAHQYTVTALGVVGTFSAVITSLAIALISQRSNRTRIKARVANSVILHSTLEGREKPTYLTVHIKNVGLLPVTIPLSFFHWKAPFRYGGWLVNPWDYSGGDEWVPQRRYPVEIKARGSQTFFLAEIEVFRSELYKMFAGARFVDWCRFLFLKARIVTDDGVFSWTHCFLG
jgi:hypothetical protein